MAYISRDSTGGEESFPPPSFVTTNDSDPFNPGGGSAGGAGVSAISWDAKRNILEELNAASENTVLLLPPPPSKESLAVFLRVKPSTQYEEDLVGQEKVKEKVLAIESDYQIALLAPKESNTYKNSINGVGSMTHRYTFTKIFNPETNQSTLFSEIVLPRVKDFLEGQNQLLFTYGATSSGKTYTIQGDKANIGVMPRAIDTIFNSISHGINSEVPLQPLGFNRVMNVSRSEMEVLKKEKDAVFRLGLDLIKEKGPLRPHVSPDESIISTASSVASSIGSTIGMSMESLLDLDQLVALFPGLEKRGKDQTKVDVRGDRDIIYSVWVSFGEVYNENTYDLLRKVPVAKKKGDKVKRPTMKLADDRTGSTYIKGLREVRVSSADEAYQLLMIGRENLHFASTRLNQQSSRSHCIFTIKVVRVGDPDQPHLARVSLLSFCDLAGSERISKTHNVGERQKEAGNINTSLLVLGRCIKAIRHNQMMKDKDKKLEVVPFRDSKLTRLFKSFFTGLGKSSLIVCISQAQYLFDETVHVCKFASIASKVTVETIKEPPPKPRNAKKPSRFSTIISGGRSRLHSTLLSGRGSIAWEAPQIRKKSSLIPATFNPAARSTIVGGVPPRLSTFMNNINETEIEETEEELENTVVDNQYEPLLALVEDLKDKLIDERKKNANLERNLREELCEEFNTMMVEIENNWEQRLQEEREEVVRNSEWRLGEIQEVHRNRNKRRREDSADMGKEITEFRSAAALKAKEEEFTNLQKELEEAQQQVDTMKDTTVRSKDKQENLQIANSKLQFELVEQQRLAAELGRDLNSAKVALQREQQEHKESRKGEEGDVLLGLERNISATREQLAKREEEVADLSELLKEAGDEFISKDEELKEAEQMAKEREGQLTQQGLVIEDLQSQLEESNMLLRETNNHLEEREQRLEDLEVELDQEKGKEEVVEKLRRQVGQLEGELRLLTEKCSAAEGYNTELKESLEAAEIVTEEEKSHAEVAEAKMLEAQSERNDLLKYKSQLLEQLAVLKENKLSNSQELETGIENIDLKQQIDSLNEENKKLSLKNENLIKKNENSKEELVKLEIKMEEYEKCRNVDESLLENEEVEGLKNEIKKLKKEKEVTEESLRILNEEANNLKLTSERENAETKNNKEKYDKLSDQLSVAEKAIVESKHDSNIVNQKLTTTNKLLMEERERCKLLEKDIQNKEDELEAAEKLVEDVVDSSKDKEELDSKYSKLLDNLNKTESININLGNELSTLKEEKSQIVKELEDLKSTKSSNQLDLLKIVELETLSGSFEKEVATKNDYITELEDIIVEKEFKISEIEAAGDKVSEDTIDSKKNINELEEKVKGAIMERDALEFKLKEAAEIQKNFQIEKEEMFVKIAENEEMKVHQDKMKQQRHDLEKRVTECGKSSKLLEETENDLRNAINKKSEIEEKLSEITETNSRLKANLEESKEEIKVLKTATKNSAKESQQIVEISAKNSELMKEMERLKPLTEAHLREEKALDLLKNQLDSKSADIAGLQQKIEYYRSSVEGKEYELGKMKEDRDGLMAHYESLFKSKQLELEKEKQRNSDSLKLSEVMARATPTKTSNELREKVAKVEAELKTTRNAQARAEDEVMELKGECRKLQREMDSKVGQHEREKNRTKLATHKVIAEYKDTNKELQRRLDVGSSSPDNSAVEASTLEADDSKTDTSLIDVTPVVKKGKGRGRTKGNRTNLSQASLASFEDSNTENELPEGSRPRVASVSRKARVTRKNSSSDVRNDNETDEEEIMAAPCRASSRKRSSSNRTASETSVLKALQVSTLSPVVEGQMSADSSGNNTLFLTPAVKKKRKLCSIAPQASEEFTPPTPSSEIKAPRETPASLAKRSLRATRSKRK